VEKISGQPGDFDVVLRINGGARTELFKAGAIVQATGWRPYDPEKLGDLGYGKFANVITGVQLEEHFKNGDDTPLLDGKPVRSVAFILCAGSRDEKHLPYCSSICCSVSLKQALYVREKYPDALVYIIYRDMRTPAQHELFYKRVQAEDNIFLTKGDVVGLGKSDDGSILIDVDNALVGEKVQIESDVVVLATGMVPSTLVGEIGAGDQDSASDGKTLDRKKAAASAEAGAKILNLAYRQGTDLPTLKYGFPDSHYICFRTRREGRAFMPPVPCVRLWITPRQETMPTARL